MEDTESAEEVTQVFVIGCSIVILRYSGVDKIRLVLG